MSEEFTVTSLGHQGDGIIHDAGETIFAPLTLVGETIRGERRGNILENIKVKNPSPNRIKPVCRHFKTCGGCQMQHLDDANQALWKQEKLSDVLEQAKLETEVKPTLSSPLFSRRRASFAAKRTKSGLNLGFHARASDLVIDISECPILRKEILAKFDAIRAVARMALTRKSIVKITASSVRNGLDLTIEGAKELEPQGLGELASICEESGILRLQWNGDLVFQSSQPEVQFGSFTGLPTPGAFLQATQEGQEQLINLTKTILNGCKELVDLFAGCGTFSLPLSEQANILALEGDANMVSAIEQAAKQRNNGRQIVAQKRDLFRRPLLPDELAKFDGLVLDPPRAGAAAQCAEIAKSNIPVLAYVSCNPASFGRDAQQLIQGGYQLEWVQPVDQFLFSPHVELAACFTKR